MQEFNQFPMIIWNLSFTEVIEMRKKLIIWVLLDE